MQLQEAINLIKKGIDPPASTTVWADLGSGKGLFTHALSTLLKQGSTVHAVDTDKAVLESMQSISNVHIEKLVANFEKEELLLQPLDGLMMANSLHYVRDKEKFFTKARKWIKSGGCILLVEYDTDHSNPWVPYPISFASATKFFHAPTYKSIMKIGEQASRYQRAGMYAARIQL